MLGGYLNLNFFGISAFAGIFGEQRIRCADGLYSACVMYHFDI